MTNLKHEKLITLAIVVGFTAQIFCLIIGMAFFPPDYSSEMPKYSPEGMMMMEFGIALFVFGATVMAIKLADERKVLAAAGFTMQAIQAGVIMASIFEIMNPTTEAWEKGYYITTSANFMYLPSMLLIAACDEFKLWVRWAGIISSIPYFITSVLFFMHYRNFTNLEYIGFAGYMLMMITQIMWAVNVYNNYRRKINASNN